MGGFEQFIQILKKIMILANNLEGYCQLLLNITVEQWEGVIAHPKIIL